MWLANVFHPERNRLNFIAPRDSAKTTIMMGAMAWVMGKAPLLTHMIVSESSTIAKDRLRAIKDMIDIDTRYKNVFPYVYIDSKRPETSTEFSVWSDQGGLDYGSWRSIVTRKGDPKGHTLRAAGVGSAIIGNRISGIMLLDDIISEDWLKPELQDKIAQYVMQTLIPFLKDEAKAINIGTRWMLDDWPERLTKNPAWFSIVISAILKRNGIEYSYWPEYWPLKKLYRRRDEMNNDVLFRLQYLNDASASTAALFQMHHLKHGLPEPLPRDEIREIYITTDTAISLRTSADWTVFQIVGIDIHHNAYLLDMVRFKAEVEDQAAVAIQLADRCLTTFEKLSGIIIENIGFQAAIAQMILRRRPELPVIPFTPQGDKMHRATLVSDYAKLGRLFINQNMQDFDELVSEWMNFPKHAHDDTLDPMGLLFQFLGMTTLEATVTIIKPRGVI